MDASSKDPQSRFLASVDRQLRKGFRKRCGVRAELLSRQSLVVVVDGRKASNRRFLRRRSPGGERITILCDGRVVARSRGGDTETVEPKTRADLHKEMLFRGCVTSCEATHPTCEEVDLSERSEAAHLCRASCFARCE